MGRLQPVDLFMKKCQEPISVIEKKRLYDMLPIENELWMHGFKQIAGVDEAGRGPLAGPIVAAAVILYCPVPQLNDSKKLSDKQRRLLFAKLQEGDHAVGIAVLSAAEIDSMGIQQANYKVMRRAIEALKIRPDFVLVDGYTLPGIVLPTRRVVKGDARSLSIAAASVVAKVTRDDLLQEIHEHYPHYGFDHNKGYGTQQHLEAIRVWGPCPEHRKSFSPFIDTGNEPLLF